MKPIHLQIVNYVAWFRWRWIYSPTETDIGNELGLARNTISSHLKNMEKAGYIKRLGKDGSIKIVNLEPKSTCFARGY